MTGHLCLKWNNHGSAFNKLLEKIYFKDIYSDATLLCNGKCYPVHRLVLSTCSIYFEEIFQQCSEINTKHPFIVIKEVESEHLEALLNYMYKGEVNVPQEILPNLIKAAEVFQIKGLAVPDEEDSIAKSSRKRFNASSNSPAPVSKKSRKQDNNIDSESKEEENNKQSTLTEIYLQENSIPVIKSEPLDSPIVELINDAPHSSELKEEDSLNFETDTFEDYTVDNLPEEHLNPIQSTSWNNSQEFTEEGSQLQRNDAIERNEMNQGLAVRIFYCNYCNYKSGKKSDAVRHERTHTGEKPFACEICDYKAVQKSTLQKHMFTHSGERPFNCELCVYTTSRKAYLKVHMMSHSKEKPYQCELCQFKTGNKSSLIRHHQAIHKC